MENLAGLRIPLVITYNYTVYLMFESSKILYNCLKDNSLFKRLFSLPIQKKDSLFLFGPRGTGKTSWIKANLSNHSLYFDLLDAPTFQTLNAHPEKLRTFIPLDFKDWIVIDEVQKIPALLDEVHKLIEENHYRFILTGSSARKLKRSGANLLAGRALKYTLHPLIIQELKGAFDLETALTLGLLPAVYTYDNPKKYIESYIEVYLREEVMQEGLTRNIGAFSRFLETASYSQGCIINSSAVAREVGVERQVIQNYFSILEDLLLAHRLPAFTKRAKRRLISSEKFYFFDAGIYNILRPKGILDTQSEVAGGGLETLFYQSALALIAYQQSATKIFFWRTVNNVEVDFVLYGEKSLIAIEIKHTKHFDSKLLIGLKHFKEDYPMAKCYLLYLGEQSLYLENGITVLNFVEGLKQLSEWIDPSNEINNE